MFKPTYRITDYFLQTIERIASIAAKIEAKKIKFSVLIKLQTEALERNVHSSTSIEGNQLSLAQVSALDHKKDVSADLRHKKEVLNYFKALRWIISNYQKPLNKSSLLKLHSLVVSGLLIKSKIGSFKKKQNYVIDGDGLVVYTPPSPAKCRKMIEELLLWLDRSGGIHPIIASAIFHHQFVNIHPFSDGNGRVARAGAQWVLYQRNFDHNHIVALDDFYARDRQRYYDKIQQTRALDYDFTYWIDYVAEGILQTVDNVYSRIENISHGVGTHIVITPKQEELVRLFNLHGSLGSKDICRILKINRSRVNQILTPLIKAKIIKKEGRARATRYFLV